MNLQLKQVPLNNPVQFKKPVMQLNTAPLNLKLNSKVDLFLNQAAITEQQIADIKQKILDYLAPNKNKYVLFRHSSLYFFVDGALDTVETTIDNFAESNYLRFDGEKVTRIDPEYYLGPIRPVKNVESEQGWTWGETTSTEYNNNNNNNNNNNGNNNG